MIFLVALALDRPKSLRHSPAQTFTSQLTYLYCKQRDMLGADAQSFVERQARLPDRAAGSRRPLQNPQQIENEGVLNGSSTRRRH
jgi:hypothetical protein